MHDVRHAESETEYAFCAVDFAGKGALYFLRFETYYFGLDNCLFGRITLGDCDASA